MKKEIKEIRKKVLIEILDETSYDLTKLEKILNFDKIMQGNLPDNFIIAFQDIIDWTVISRDYYLTQKEIEQFQNKVDWEAISIYQKLSEKFIKKFQLKVDWLEISLSQKLSDKFIKEFKEELDLEEMRNLKIISKEFYEELINPKPPNRVDLLDFEE